MHNKHMSITASEARIPVDVFNRVVYKGERVEVKRLRGKASVYLVSEEDMRVLEEYGDNQPENYLGTPLEPIDGI